VSNIRNLEILMVPSQLKTAATAIRRKLLEMHYKAKSSHLGTGLSEVDILTYLYGHWLTKSDRFILSKGHGASGLYATLHHFGRMSDDILNTYYKDNTKLAAHPSPMALEEIPVATGSLGHGLSVACGIAWARKLRGDNSKVACLVSDGECNEGSIWEAALFAGHHKLNNLVVIVDNNGLQGFGYNKDVLNLNPFADKWRAFNFHTQEIDGHNFDQMNSAFSFYQKNEKPLCIVANTIKGKGVSYMEDKLEWHYLNLDEKLFQQAMKELEAP
jgi:transketolase